MRIENRKHTRYPIFAFAEMTTANADGIKAVTAMMYNICKSGMGLCSEKPLRKGAPVSIELIKIMDTKIRDRIHGSVIWTSDRDYLFNMGIRFDEEINSFHQPNLYEKLFERVDAE